LNVEGIPQDYNKIDAEVSVVGSDGSCFNGTSLGDGKYQVVIGSLNKDASYSLKIVYEGDIYTSEPQYPLETETIDDVTYEQPENTVTSLSAFLCGVKMADVISGVTRKIGK